MLPANLEHRRLASPLRPCKWCHWNFSWGCIEMLGRNFSHPIASSDVDVRHIGSRTRSVYGISFCSPARWEHMMAKWKEVECQNHALRPGWYADSRKADSLPFRDFRMYWTNGAWSSCNGSIPFIVFSCDQSLQHWTPSRHKTARLLVVAYAVHDIRNKLACGWQGWFVISAGNLLPCHSTFPAEAAIPSVNSLSH